MSRVKNALMIVIFMLIIFGFSIASFLEPDRSSSDIEFRTLTTLSKPTKSSLITGDYFKKIDNYMSDQFFKRDNWVKTYINFNMNVINKSRINNIVLGKEGYLLNFNPLKNLEEVKDDSFKSIKTNTTNINDLSEYLKDKNKSFYFVTIPTQSGYNYDKYPNFMNNNKEKQNYVENTFFNLLNKDVNVINMREIFDKSKEKDLYYKTDHHWNMNGAFLGYQNIIEKIHDKYPSIGKPYIKDDYDIKSYPGFKGSENRQISLMLNTDDTIDLWYPKYKLPSYKKFVSGEEDNRLFYTDNLKANNTYSTYMNGDEAEIVIETNRTSLPNALIFGDSFTNPVEPYLSQHFNTTRILDLRHYKDMNLYSYIDKYKPDVVIMILNSGDLDGAGGNLGIK